MRTQRYFSLFLIFAIILTFTVSCSKEPTPTTEPNITSTSSSEDITEEPTSSPSPSPEEVEEDSELVWKYIYDNEKFGAYSLAMDPEGALVTIGTFMATYTHRLYDGEPTDVDTDYPHTIEQIAYSPDGKYLVSGMGAYGVSIKDLTEEKEPVQLHGGYNNFVAFSSDGNTLATGNRDASIWLWSLPEAEQVTELPDEDGQYLWGLAYHPSGEEIASLQSQDDGVINIWSIADREIIHTFTPGINVLATHNAIGYSPDGTMFAAYFQEDYEQFVRIFDTETYEVAYDIGLEKRISNFAFSPDSSMIAVASINLPTTIWSTDSGELLYTLDQENIGTTNGTNSLAFTPDGGHLGLIRNKTGELELWRLPGFDPIPEPEIDIYQPVPIPGDVLFDTGSFELKSEADEILGELAEDILNALPEAKLTFVGHTDSQGDAAANMELSLKRATSVRDWFETWAQDNGIDGWTFEVDGKGETQLKVVDVDGENNFREEAGRVNRRVEIVIDPFD